MRTGRARLLGFSLDAPIVAGVVPGVATPLIAAIAWGAYVALHPRDFQPGIDEAWVEPAVLGAAVLALAVSGPAGQAWAFAALVVVNTALTTIWRQHWYA